MVVKLISYIKKKEIMLYNNYTGRSILLGLLFYLRVSAMTDSIIIEAAKEIVATAASEGTSIAFSMAKESVIKLSKQYDKKHEKLALFLKSLARKKRRKSHRSKNSDRSFIRCS